MFFFSFLFCRYKSGEETEIIREVERETTRSLFVALSFSLSIENQVCLEDIQQTRWTLLLTALLSIGSLFLHRTKRNLAHTHTHKHTSTVYIHQADFLLTVMYTVI